LQSIFSRFFGGGVLVKTLPVIRPTAEQLPLISDNNLGIEVIRGAAGSGKTSTAILRLRSLAYMFEERREREGTAAPVKILVLTFNRTLRGYIHALVDDQVSELKNTIVTIDTFSRWAMQHLGRPNVVNDAAREAKIKHLGRSLTALSAEYLVREVEYILGRFEPDELERYMTTERTGRGTEPRVEAPLRRRIIDEVITPYRQWLGTCGLCDWNDVAVAMATAPEQRGYDVVIVDESQDFSANQLRAIRHHIAPEHAVTFVIDTVQRIYARGFTWAEAGFNMRGARYHTLKENHRNTAEIAAFAAGLLENVAVEEDGALPDLTAARRHGGKPVVIRGKYDPQAAWALAFLRKHVDLATETVAFLKPRTERGTFYGEAKPSPICLNIKSSVSDTRRG
jgi:superfamily I DNA/RNA helicase